MKRAIVNSSETKRSDSSHRRIQNSHRIHSPANRANRYITRPTLEEMVQVLPSVWLSDDDLQRIAQWVVYAFLTETDQTDQTPARAKAGIERAAVETDLNVSGIAMLCTNTLYRDQNGTPTTHFCRDLETIENRVRDGTR